MSVSLVWTGPAYPEVPQWHSVLLFPGPAHAVGSHAQWGCMCWLWCGSCSWLTACPLLTQVRALLSKSAGSWHPTESFVFDLGGMFHHGTNVYSTVQYSTVRYGTVRYHKSKKLLVVTNITGFVSNENSVPACYSATGWYPPANRKHTFRNLHRSATTLTCGTRADPRHFGATARLLIWCPFQNDIP
jgi:hypothetical protein